MLDAALNTATKAQTKQMIKASVDKLFAFKQKIENPSSEAKSIDYEISVLLSMIEDKEALCLELISNLGKYKTKLKEKEKKVFISELRDYILGKIFYLNLKKSKVLLIDQLITEQNKSYVLQVIETIEGSELQAVSVIDPLPDGRIKNFFNGVISYLY